MEVYGDATWKRESINDLVSLLLEGRINLHCANCSCQTASHAKGNFVGHNNRDLFELDGCQNNNFVAVGEVGV